MKWPWQRKDPTRRAYAPPPAPKLEDFDTEHEFDDAVGAIDKALYAHAAAESRGIDEMYLLMLTQIGEDKCGLLVETSYRDDPNVDFDTNVMSLSIDSTITLSPEVPFGEIRYRNK